MKGLNYMNNKFSNIHLLLLALTLGVTTSCYDLEGMGHNPYEIEDKTSEAGTDTVTEETTGKYADLNLNFKISKDDSVTCKTDLAGAASTFRNFLYEGYYNDYQITTNLSHDIYAGYVANNQPKHAKKSLMVGVAGGGLIFTMTAVRNIAHF